jgi:hypothetical protein
LISSGFQITPSNDTLEVLKTKSHDKGALRIHVYVGCGNYVKGKDSGVPSGGGGVQIPPPEISKALQNRAKFNPIVKTVKNC